MGIISKLLYEILSLFFVFYIIVGFAIIELPLMYFALGWTASRVIPLILINLVKEIDELK